MSRKRTRPLVEIIPTTLKETTKFMPNYGVKITARNEHQKEYLKYLFDPAKVIVIASGPAGCGKTQLAMLSSIKALSENQIEKIILCRPAVGVADEEHGFVPGTLLDKIRIWVTPLLEVLSEYYSSREIETMLDKQIIEIVPLMLIRGRNFKNCHVILDEAQNISIPAIKSIMTRLCENSKLIITGDNDQSDRRSGENGLLIFKKLLYQYGGNPYIAEIEFNCDDNQRHPIVTEILKIFNNGY